MIDIKLAREMCEKATLETKIYQGFETHRLSDKHGHSFAHYEFQHADDLEFSHFARTSLPQCLDEIEQRHADFLIMYDRAIAAETEIESLRKRLAEAESVCNQSEELLQNSRYVVPDNFYFVLKAWRSQATEEGG